MAVNGILLGQNNNNIEISEQNFQSFRTAGSYSYTIPKTGWYYILMSGGGGGGSGGWPYINTRSGKFSGGGNGGGAGAMFDTYEFFLKGSQLKLIVGEGGKGGSGGTGGGSYGYANGFSGKAGGQSTIGSSDYILFQADGGGGAAPIFYPNTGEDTNPGSSSIGTGGSGTWVYSGNSFNKNSSPGNGPNLFPFNSFLISKNFLINTSSSAGGIELNNNIGGGGGGGNSWLAPGGNGGNATINSTRDVSTDGKNGTFGSGGGGGGQANGRNIESNQGVNGGNGGDGFIIIVSL